MFDRLETDSLKTIKVTIVKDYWAKISRLKSQENSSSHYCVWLRKGNAWDESEEGSEAVAMFIIEPINTDLWMLVSGGSGDGELEALGTLRECFERVFVTFKSLAALDS